jgi:hypothetical protein
MCGPTTATVPIEMFGPQSPGVSTRLTILDKAPGAVQCQDPLGSLLPADKLHQRLHVPTWVQQLRSRCTLSPFGPVDPI